MVKMYVLSICIASLIMLNGFELIKVAASATACDPDLEFTCYISAQCVPATHVNDTIRDCDDYTDEGVATAVPCKAGRLKCVDGSGCVQESDFNDDWTDCTEDKSDEWLAVGLKCAHDDGRPYQIACSAAFPLGVGEGATCDPDTRACVCRSGYMAQDRGKTCQRRRLYSPCPAVGHDSDCTDAVPNTVCAEHPTAGDAASCVCAPGYYAQLPANDTCVKRKIGDDCDLDADCADAVANSACSNATLTCVCLHHYLVTADRRACLTRKVGDPCEASDQCEFAITNVECADDNKCTCLPGFEADQTKTTCLNETLVLSPDDCSDMLCVYPWIVPTLVALVLLSLLLALLLCCLCCKKNRCGPGSGPLRRRGVLAYGVKSPVFPRPDSAEVLYNDTSHWGGGLLATTLDRLWMGVRPARPPSALYDQDNTCEPDDIDAHITDFSAIVLRTSTRYDRQLSMDSTITDKVSAWHCSTISDKLPPVDTFSPPPPPPRATHKRQTLPHSAGTKIRPAPVRH